MEIVRHDLDEARQQASDLKAANAVLQAKISAMETAPPPPAPLPSPGPAPSAEAAPPTSPLNQLSAAEAAARSGDWASAEPILRDYVERYGDGPHGPEAKYYLGKALMVRHVWADSATAEIGAIRGWPATSWAPEAVLVLSKDLVSLQKPADACQALDELARRYPKPKSGPAVLRAAVDLRAQAKCG